MDVKQAVSIAKSWVTEIMADEQPANVGLEEVSFDETREEWIVTIGFSRAWEKPTGPFATLASASAGRVYKTISVDDLTGKVRSMKRSEAA